MKRIFTYFMCSIFAVIFIGLFTTSSFACKTDSSPKVVNTSIEMPALEVDNSQLNKDLEDNNSKDTNLSTPAEDFVFDPITQTIEWYSGSNNIVDIPSSINGIAVLHIGSGAFFRLEVTSVTIPEGIVSIDNIAFMFCGDLKHVSIPSSMKVIGTNAFLQCIALEDVTLPIGLQAIGTGAFLNCTSLKKITIPNTVTTLGIASFYNCTTLESLTLSNQITDIQESTFVRCAFKDIVIPDSVINIYNSAFLSASKAETLTLSSDLEYIGVQAFSYMPLLKNLVIPNSVTYIDAGAFMGDAGLENIMMSKNLENIGPVAFNECRNLTNIVLPESLATIGERAFADDNNLESAIFTGIAPTTWGVDIFENVKAGFRIYYYAENTGFSTPKFNEYPCYPLYRVNTLKTSGGNVSISPDRAAQGDTVTIVATPDLNYMVKSMYYIDTTGKHNITGSSFIMPDSAVTVNVTFIYNYTYQLIIALTLIFVLSLIGVFVLLFAR